MAEVLKEQKKREAGMMVCAGIQGVGKTYQNMHVIAQYVKDKLHNKVRGRKCLIFDTNGEYTADQFAANGIPNFDIKRIAVSDVAQWCRADVQECRRIDAKSLGIKQKKECVEDLLRVYKNGMLVLDDINTYILSVTFMEEIVGGLVNLRHRAVDVLISYQSLRAVEPRIWQNSRWVKMFYQSASTEEIKNKVTNPTLFRIAQLIVNNRYLHGDKRFFVYIFVNDNKVKGLFKRDEFNEACKKYLNSNKKYIKEYKDMNDCTYEEAVDGAVEQLADEYYGNVELKTN